MITEKQQAQLKSAKHVIRALDHKLRREIIEYLMQGEQNETSIYVHFRIEQSVAAQHIGILYRAGLLVKERRGKYIYMAASKGAIDYLLRMCRNIGGLMGVEPELED